MKKADKGVTNLINERAYNKDRAVTTKKEKKQIMNGLRKASKTANKVRNTTYKKEVTKNGNTGVDGFKKKILNKNLNFLGFVAMKEAVYDFYHKKNDQLIQTWKIFQ